MNLFTKQSFFALVLIALFESGCATRTTGAKGRTYDGSLSKFIEQRVVAFGGHFALRPNGPYLPGSWTYREDNFGGIIKSQDISFQQIDNFIKEYFGSPVEGGKTPEGETQWVIPAKQIGVSIWYSKLNEGVQLTVLRPLNLP